MRITHIAGFIASIASVIVGIGLASGQLPEPNVIFRMAEIGIAVLAGMWTFAAMMVEYRKDEEMACAELRESTD